LNFSLRKQLALDMGSKKQRCDLAFQPRPAFEGQAQTESQRFLEIEWRHGRASRTASGSSLAAYPVDLRTDSHVAGISKNAFDERPAGRATRQSWAAVTSTPLHSLHGAKVAAGV
jgi:hypothetical protein